MIKITNNEPLRNHTTFRVGGPASYYTEVESAEQLAEALQWAEEHQQTVFVLGGGSNLIFLDEGYKGLVIKPNFMNVLIDGNQVTVGAGVLLSELIHQTLDYGLVGLEFAAGIPGTVGGAVRGNAGTFGVQMSDVTDTVDYYDIVQKVSRTCLKDECDFRYRHSMFKAHNYFITQAHLTLEKGDTELSRKIIADRIAVRMERHPTEPSAGCIFKNVLFADANLQKLESKGLDLEKFKEYQKIPAGYLIESLGLKGKSIGDAQVSEKHANYIINNGKATAEHVIQLISLIKQQVRDAYSVQLEEEAHIVYNS